VCCTEPNRAGTPHPTLLASKGERCSHHIKHVGTNLTVTVCEFVKLGVKEAEVGAGVESGEEPAVVAVAAVAVVVVMGGGRSSILVCQHNALDQISDGHTVCNTASQGGRSRGSR